MISRFDLDERVREWGLRDDVVEKDYVIGWLLWGIGNERRLASSWVFKGGTCLKKCYIETYRFSEDLDFTVLPDGPLTPEDVTPLLAQVLQQVYEASGIILNDRSPRFKRRPSGDAAVVQIYYRGPRNAPTVASVKLDLSGAEKLARDPVLRPIAHPYPDPLPHPATVSCYCFEEVFAEKIRAMGERGRPRDLYDILNLFHRQDGSLSPEIVGRVLREKCASKGVPVPTFASIEQSGCRPELEAEWENMLAHQLPGLPPFESFWEELPALFDWLEGRPAPALPAPAPIDGTIDTSWEIPPTVHIWGTTVSIEAIRFAAVNHLCIELGYQGSTRLIEPYSFRRTTEGNTLLYAVKHVSGELRAYRVDRVESVRVTGTDFTPRYRVEVGSFARRAAPRLSHSKRPEKAKAPRENPSTAAIFVVQCPICGRKFRRQTPSTTLRPHKTPDGWPCPSSSGHIVEVRS